MSGWWVAMEVLLGEWHRKSGPRSAGIARARLLEVLEDDHRRFHDERRRVLLNRFPAYPVGLGLFDGLLASVGELIRQPKTEWVPLDSSVVAAAPHVQESPRTGNSDCNCDLCQNAQAIRRANLQMDPWNDGRWSFEGYNLSLIHKPMRKVCRWVFP